MKRFLFFGTIVFCAAVAAIVIEIVRRAYFEEKGSPSHLRRIAAQINERAPMEIGDLMEVTRASWGEKLLTVQYRVHVTAAELDSTARRNAREVLRSHACTQDALRELLDNGVSLHYVLVDDDDAEILTTDILRWECGGVGTASSR